MGRNNRKRVLKRDFKEPRENVWREKRQKKGDAWASLELDNEQFTEYYKMQKIVPEGEFDEFLRVLRIPLPTTFRVNGSGKFAADLIHRMETDFLANFKDGPVMVAGEELQPPKPLAWYPNKLAWQYDFSRAQLRKIPVLDHIHEFMKRENDAGAITRQEAVSMVPPLFLDVQPHHKVLDMCAAPGSKTFQILEMLHATSNLPDGLVVANDMDAARCNLLTHQVKRMCSAALMITNHDASQFPLLAPKADPKNPYLYDRILCDVPCSGDGTLRKAPDIWRRWSQGNGNGLHPLQLRIALHACRLLAVGGRMIYSTCTFNPIEDEAVVAELLRRTKGAMQLVDVSGQLPALKYMPGLHKWVVKNQGRFFNSWAEAVEHAAGHPLKIDPTMFPDVESDALPLERCMRILPHHNDTGGFFIAVLEKVAPIGELPRPDLSHRYQRKAKQAGKENGSAAPASTADTDEAAAELLAAAAAAADGDAAAEEDAVVAEAEAAGDEAPAPVEEDVPQPSGAAGVEDAAQARTAPAGDETAEAAATTEAGAQAEPAKAAEPAAAEPQWGARGGGGRGRQGGGGRWGSLDPIMPVTDPVILSTIVRFYGLHGAQLEGQLVTRSLENARPKRIYYVGAGVKRLLLLDEAEQLKVTATGLKTFERQESKDVRCDCFYRIAQEGLPMILPYITKQLVPLSAADLLRVLQERAVPLPPALHTPAMADKSQWNAANGAATDKEATTAAATSTAAEAPPVADSSAGQEAAAAAAPEAEPADIDTVNGAPEEKAEGEAAAEEAEAAPAAAAKQRGPPLSDPAALERLQETFNGCCICTLREEEAVELGLGQAAGQAAAEGAVTAWAPIAVACWRGRATLNVLVGKPECLQLAEKLRTAMQARERAAGAQAGAAAAGL